MRRLSGWTLALLLTGAIAATPILAQDQPSPPAGTPAAAEGQPGQASARITYITGASIYLDAGRQEGLREGDTVEVTRDGATVATLKVTYLSDHRSSCVVVSSTTAPAVGDVVRFVPRAPRSSGGAAGPQGSTAGSGSAAAGSSWMGRLHGRAGVRYLAVRDTSGGAQDNGFSQPSLDLRLDGYGLGGGGFDVNVDVRARQTYRYWPGSEDDRSNRVYRLSSTYHLPDTRQRITLGRQFAPNVEALNLFDGVLYDLDNDRWGAGLFAGSQPDPVDFSYDGTVREYGGYWLVHSTLQQARQWAVALGLIDSYADGEVNREWFYLQSRYRGPRLSAFLTQEIDYNRSWKVSQFGESTFSPTSTFATLNYRAGDKVTLRAGYDNRRSVPLWLDRITPGTVFDDTHRQGGWAGASFRLAAHFQVGADARVSTGGPSGRADGYSADLGWDGIGAANFSFQARTTEYANDHSDGWMHTLTSGLDLGRAAHLELAVGRVEETDKTDSTLDRTDDWYGVDVDILLGRHWYLILSKERYTGTFQDNDQSYAAVTFRF